MFNIKCRNLPFLLTAAASLRVLCLELKLLQSDCIFRVSWRLTPAVSCSRGNAETSNILTLTVNYLRSRIEELNSLFSSQKISWLTDWAFKNFTPETCRVSNFEEVRLKYCHANLIEHNLLARSSATVLQNERHPYFTKSGSTS